MLNIQATTVITFCAVIGSALLGCGDVPRSNSSTQVSSQDHSAKVEIAEDDAGPATQYVTCRATLAAVDNNYLWHEGSDVGHDVGAAPLASFVLSEPAAHADRGIGVLFKHAPRSGVISPPDQDDIGSDFTFQLPADFLTGTFTSIDNLSVKQLRKVEL